MSHSLLAHASKYTIGNLLVTIAGFVSFPLFTRLFAVDEYGLMSLVATTLMIAVGLGKVGFQHSMVRYYAETRAGNNAFTLPQYFATVLGAMGALAFASSALWILVVELLPNSAWSDPRLVTLLRLTAVLVFIRIFESAFVNLLRAEQRSGTYSAYQVVRRYGSLVIIIVTVLYVVHGVYGFYVGTVIGEAVMVAGLAIVYLRRQPIQLSQFQPALFRSMALFGLPMVGYEIGGVILSAGDRYVLGALAGPEQLGLYSAAYNLCEYVQNVLLVSLGQALIPMYTRIWEEKGAQETVRFISRVLHFYLLLGALVVALLGGLGQDILALLASEKYRPAGTLLPWLIAGKVLEGGLPIVAAGIFIRKQTQTIMLLVLASAALNIGLNFAFVPRFGVLGSAMASLVAYFTLVVTSMVMGQRRLPVRFPVGALLKFGSLGAVTYLAMSLVHVSAHVAVEIVLRGTIGCAVFVGLVLVFDAPSREMARMVLGRAKLVLQSS
jgi:O-antigen/teichoic acid export membrane protein